VEIGKESISLLKKNFLGFSEIADFNSLGINFIRQNSIMILETMETVSDLNILSIGLCKVISQIMVHRIEILDLILVGIIRHNGIVQFDSGGVQLGIEFGDVGVELVDLGHQGVVGLVQLGALGLGSGELLGELSIGLSTSVDCIGQFSNCGVQGGDLFGKSGVGLLKLADSGLEVVAAHSEVVDLDSSGVEFSLKRSNGVIK